jgi:hypothetical protein
MIDLYNCVWNNATNIEDLEDKLQDKVSDTYYKESDDDLIGRYVKVKYTNKSTYKKEGVLGKYGKVERISSADIGVAIDGMKNEASSYGVYWFKKSELKVLNRESEELEMKGYDKVAIVNLLEDNNKKDYGFALYDHEWKSLYGEGSLVVVNPINKDKRVLATLKNIVTKEEYEATHKNKITAQVVGVVDMYGYNIRVAEEERLKELAKKKAAIEKELQEEINKRKSIEYYEAMAKEYADNPRLAALVNELKELGE